MNLFGWRRRTKTPDDILRILDTDKLTRSVFRPYYLNDEKVNDFFVQQYGGLVQFTKSHGKEVGSSLGVDVKTDGPLAILSSLRAGADAKRSEKRTEGLVSTHELVVLARFILLHTNWKHSRALEELNTITDPMELARHTLVSYTGRYWFSENANWDTSNIPPSVSAEQMLAIKKQQEFERKAEKETHYLYFIEQSVPAVAIISKVFTTHVGFRYLPHDSGKESDTLFIGAVIGPKQDVLFLDPIAIGHMHQ
jgi:hypothetical protein